MPGEYYFIITILLLLRHESFHWLVTLISLRTIIVNYRVLVWFSLLSLVTTTLVVTLFINISTYNFLAVPSLFYVLVLKTVFDRCPLQ